jgi:hypothetical protein
MNNTQNILSILLGKPELRILLDNSRIRWQDNIKTNFRWMGYEIVDWIQFFEYNLGKSFGVFLFPMPL